MAFDAALLFHDAAALTATGNSSALDVKKTAIDGITVELAVTAASGTTPTLDVTIQESDDNSTWRNVSTFPQITGTGRWFRRVASGSRYLRAARTVGGTTPSFTVTCGVVSGVQRDYNNPIV